MDTERRGLTGTTVALIVTLILSIGLFGVVSWRTSFTAHIAPQDEVSTSTGSAVPPPGETVVATSTAVSMAPSSGPVGTTVTVSGMDFGATSTVTINGLVAASLRNLKSADGKTLKFKIPGTLGPDCAPTQICAQFLLNVTPGPYSIAVASGLSTMNIGIFTVTGAGSAGSSAPASSASAKTTSPPPPGGTGGKFPAGLKGFY